MKYLNSEAVEAAHSSIKLQEEAHEFKVKNKKGPKKPHSKRFINIFPKI